jgi:hypothetical protein
MVTNMMIQSMIEMNQICLNEKDTKLNNGNFEKLLIKSVDNAFSSLFHSHKQILYSHLLRCYNINKQAIPYAVDDFVNALQEIFGSGAKLVEIEIIKSLYALVQNYTFAPNQSDLSFTEYVRAIRSLWQTHCFSAVLILENSAKSRYVEK